MTSIALVLIALSSPLGDSARLVGSTIVVEPIGVEIALPGEWFGAKDTVASLTCGHALRGSVEQRFATTRLMLDSLLNAKGEWDREYSAVTDSVLPFADLVAQVGPEPFGRGGGCFGDLQMRVYVFQIPSILSEQAKNAGLRTARGFFPSATLASKDSARWHIDRLKWDAFYYDYGGQANIEIFTTTLRENSVAIVFMHLGADVAADGPVRTVWSSRGPAERDQRFVLEHIRFR